MPAGGHPTGAQCWAPGTLVHCAQGIVMGGGTGAPVGLVALSTKCVGGAKPLRSSSQVAQSWTACAWPAQSSSRGSRRMFARGMGTLHVGRRGQGQSHNIDGPLVRIDQPEPWIEAFSHVEEAFVRSVWHFVGDVFERHHLLSISGNRHQ